MASSEITECADTAPSQDRPAPAAFSPGVAALTSIALAGSARSAIDRELLARIDERQRRHIVLSLQRTVGNTTVSALVAPRRLAREIRGDVTQISIDPSFARALTDDELAGQVGLLRGRLATAPDLALQANLAVLENEVLRRNPATQPAPATAPPNGPLPPGAIPLGVVGTPLAAGILQPVTLSTGPGMPPAYAPPTTPQAPPGAWEYRPPPTITKPSPDLAKIGVSTGAMIAAVGAFLIVFFYSRPTQPSWMDRNPLTGMGYSSLEEFDQVRQMTPEAFQQEMARRSGRRWGSMTLVTRDSTPRQAPAASGGAPVSEPSTPPPAVAPPASGQAPVTDPVPWTPASAPGATNATETLQAAGRRPADLPSWGNVSVKWNHISDGHWDGTPLAPGAQPRRIGNNDMFNGLSKDAIEALVRAAYAAVDQKLETQGDRIRVRGRAGIWTVEFWVNKATREVETAYPIFP